MTNKLLPDDYMKQLQSVYPKRHGGQGWRKVRTELIPKLIKEGVTFEDLLEAAKGYGDYCRATNDQYVRMAQTFFGPGGWWEEEYDIPTDGSVELTLDQEATKYGIMRQEGEDDESLRNRVGIAMTKQRYAK
jgi:hypothetical protein